MPGRMRRVVAFPGPCPALRARKTKWMFAGDRRQHWMKRVAMDMQQEPTDVQETKSKSRFSRRTFLKGTALVAVGAYAGKRGYGYLNESKAKAKVVIVGGGTAGLTMAAYLQDLLRYDDITIIEPNDDHHYQPGYTMIAGGIFTPEEVVRPTKDLIPSQVKWIQDSVAEVNADNNCVMTRKNGKVTYDFLVLVPGCQMNFGEIQGISREDLGKGGVHCIYDYKGAAAMRDAMRKLPETKGGKLVFTTTHTKLKCGGAPKKIMLMTEHSLRMANAREKFNFQYFTPEAQLMKPKIFGDRLATIFKERNVPISLKHKLVGIDMAGKKAVFETEKDAGAKERINVEFDLLHFVPPMSSPDFVRQSSLADAANPSGWLKVDKETLVHAKYRNIITFGDVAGLPTSKTGAAIRKQAAVAAPNLVALMEGKAPTQKYSGYSACPIITEYGKVLMCEFGYDEKLMPTFPWLDPGVEREMWWTVKARVLKPMYFHGMLRGRV